MIHLSRWKVVLLVLSLLFGLLFSYPNLLTADQHAALPGWLPKSGLNLISLANQGGAFMYPLYGLSILAMTMGIERAIAIRRSTHKEQVAPALGIDQDLAGAGEHLLHGIQIHALACDFRRLVVLDQHLPEAARRRQPGRQGR